MTTINNLEAIPPKTNTDGKNKTIIDYHEKQRQCKAPFMYVTPNCVLFYGKTCDRPVISKHLVQTMNVIEKYLACIETDFGIKRVTDLDTRRFTVYLSHSGLDPYPADPGVGIIGYANEYEMTLIPDIFMNARTDPSMIIHELGHALFHVNGYPGWLEESLNEYMAHFYVPKLCTIYDVTRGFVINKHFQNILGVKTQQSDDRYNFGCFWAFIADTFGGNKVVGAIADHAFKSVNGSVDANLWACIAQYLCIDENDLIMRWVDSLLQVKFWQSNPIIFDIVKRNFKNQTSLNPRTLTWEKPTTTIDELKNMFLTRVEKAGFEVVLHSDKLDAIINELPFKCGIIRVTHLQDGRAIVSHEPYVVNGMEVIRKRMCAIIRL
jgi:hypothetical protein